MRYIQQNIGKTELTLFILQQKKIIFYGGNFNTISLYNQKVDVHHIKRSKAKELGAIRPQRPKIFWLGKNFF